MDRALKAPGGSESRAYALIERASAYAIETRRSGDRNAECRARVARHVISSAAQRAGAISARELRGSPGLRKPLDTATFIPDILRILRTKYPGLEFDLFPVKRGDGLQGLAFEIPIPFEDDDRVAIGREFFSTTERTYPGRILLRMIRMIEYCLHRYGIPPGWTSPNERTDEE